MDFGCFFFLTVHDLFASIGKLLLNDLESNHLININVRLFRFSILHFMFNKTLGLPISTLQNAIILIYNRLF